MRNLVVERITNDILAAYMFSTTMAEQPCVCCLLEDDNGGPESWEGNIQTTAAGKGSELRGEVLQVGHWGAAQEQEHVIVEALGPCAIYHNIRHGQHLEKTSRHRAGLDRLYEEKQTHRALATLHSFVFPLPVWSQWTTLNILPWRYF